MNLKLALRSNLANEEEMIPSRWLSDIPCRAGSGESLYQ